MEEFFNERAAIREYLGGYTRKEAERLAWEEVKERQKASGKTYATSWMKKEFYIEDMLACVCASLDRNGAKEYEASIKINGEIFRVRINRYDIN